MDNNLPGLFVDVVVLRVQMIVDGINAGCLAHRQNCFHRCYRVMLAVPHYCPAPDKYWVKVLGIRRQSTFRLLNNINRSALFTGAYRTESGHSTYGQQLTETLR